MRSRGVVVVLACLLLVLAGCGVAGETGVTRDREAARLGLSSDNPDQAVPAKREHSNDAAQIVANYLRAAAGDREHAVERVREFLQPGIRGSFNPGPEILVVRQLELVASPKAGGSSDVRVRLQPVGVLTDQGAIKPLGPGEPAMIEHSFVVSPSEAGQPDLYVSQPYPHRLLLSTSALAPLASGKDGQDSEVLYRPHLLYFWDTEFRTLVPDLRYLPRSIERAQRPTEVVRWLMAGPSEWLRPAVQSPPAGTEVRGNVVRKGDRVVVDLNAKAGAPGAIPPEKLLAQLRWSLWEWHQYDPIILQIEGQEKASDPASSDYKGNPAAELASNPASFCIADGVVVVECSDRAANDPPMILKSPDNSQVRSAAIARRDGTHYAALVRAAGNRRTLVVGRAKPGDAAPTYVPTSLTVGSLSRPVWLNPTESPAKGLIVADGRLHWFDVDGKVAPLSGGGNGIQAVAVAPDARRIAFIAGGSVYVAPLAAQRGVLTVGGAQRLQTTVGGLTAVGFSRPERLVVAGTGSLAELSVDGAIEEQVHALGDSKVTGLAAYPDNPANGSTRGAVLIEIGDTASQVFANRLQPISWVGPPASASPPAGGQKPAPKVTAAFFEG